MNGRRRAPQVFSRALEKQNLKGLPRQENDFPAPRNKGAEEEFPANSGHTCMFITS
jgi:hypothetical protein